MSDHDSVFFSDFEIPDRSTSASAPPALEIATESVFAFTVEYAKIFSDIRTHEDYYNYYERAPDRTKLPAPLQTSPFFDEYDEGRFRGGDKSFLERNNFKSNRNNLDEEDARRDLEKLRIGRTNHEEDDRSTMWNPQARKFGIHFEDPTIARLQHEQIVSGSWSSPSAQNVFNTAQYLWRDEEQQNQSFSNIPPQMNGTIPQSNENTTSTSSSTSNQRQNAFFTESDEISNGNQSESSEEHELNRSQPCRYYAAGYCSRGEKCFYSHEGEVQQDKSKKEKKSKNKGFRNQPKATTTPNGQSKNLSSSSSSTPEPYYEFDQLIGKIYMVSKDQQGCRFLQRKLEERDPQAIQIIFSEVFDHITELMTDPFGNYLCQKLLEFCNEEQRFKIVEKVSPHLVSIAKNMHGTRAVQKLIECLKAPQQIELIKRALSNHVVELIQDLNGNHVIQRCLNRLSSKDNQFIYDAVTKGDNCVQVATHRHGCCVLQRCIDHASDNQKMQLIQEIILNALALVQDAYGNYVVQYILDLPFPDLVDRLARSFSKHIVQLSTQKFSSNVVEKCLKVGNSKTQDLIISELSKEDTLPFLLQDPYANYVIQTALNSADPKKSQQFADAIRPFSNLLRNTPYGKRILSLVNKGK